MSKLNTVPAVLAILPALLAACAAPARPPAAPTRAPLAAATAARPRALDRQGHRGARGLHPENSLEGFAAALAIGVDTLEMDVLLTRDDVLVVHHDERLNPDLAREPGGAWLAAPTPTLRSLAFADLSRYDVGRIRPGSAYAARFAQQQGRDGVRIPALADVFALAERTAGGRVRYNLEVKTTPTAPGDTADPAAVVDAMLALARGRGVASRVTIQSFDWRALARTRAAAPGTPTSCLSSDETIQRGAPGASPWTAGLDVDAYGGSVPRLVRAAGCTIWSPDHQSLSREAVAEAQALGLRVVPWTANEPTDIQRLVSWGVDGIISDYPDRLPGLGPRRE